MCGIVGAIAQRNVTNILITGLKRLEYRGYDSAGVALVNANGLQRVRRQGKVAALEEAVREQNAAGFLGIAHTRWATHGRPSEANAHPHQSGDGLAVVHNGIIENFQDLKDELEGQGYQFQSQTDTEVIAHLVHRTLEETGGDLKRAVQKAVKQLHGAYALGVVDQREPDRLVAVRSGSPLVVGLGIDENYVASDQLALLPVTNRFIFLEEGDLVELTVDRVGITDVDGNPVEREVHEFDGAHEDVEKGEYRHFMQKEIFEQPAAIQRTLQDRIDSPDAVSAAFGDRAEAIFDRVRTVQIVACGTSYHAGMVARYWLEALAGIPCQVEVASEFRYRRHVVPAGTLFVTISQSGETADTLAALRDTRSDNYVGRLAICNVDGSSLVRESELTFLTKAGPEIGVASTKAFTTQLAGLMMLALALVDKEMPVVAVAPNDELLEKLKSNLQEVRARGGELYLFADKHARVSDGEGIHVLHLPAVPEIIAPIVYTVPLQLLSYHVAVLRGTDVDQPRNLAKSVTVE